MTQRGPRFSTFMMEAKHQEGKEGLDEKDSDELGGWAHIEFEDIEMGERIGGGGVGVIYDGYYRGKPVALKTLFDSRIGADLKKEYMDELLVMSKLKHSNIVTFIGACMTPPNLCFVMERCQCSLFQLLHVDRISLSDRDIVQMAVRTFEICF